MAKQRWKIIPGCSNYAIGSHGQVKRIRHKARGYRYKIMKEQIVKLVYDLNRNPTARIIDDSGKQRQLGVEKLVITQFLLPNKLYYKIVSRNDVTRVDCYLDSELYERMKDKPTIYKTIKS